MIFLTIKQCVVGLNVETERRTFVLLETKNYLILLSGKLTTVAFIVKRYATAPPRPQSFST